MKEKPRAREMGIAVEVIDPLPVKSARAADRAVDFVFLVEEEFGKVGAVLAADSSNKSFFYNFKNLPNRRLFPNKGRLPPLRGTRPFLAFFYSHRLHPDVPGPGSLSNQSESAAQRRIARDFRNGSCAASPAREKRDLERRKTCSGEIDREVSKVSEQSPFMIPFRPIPSFPNAIDVIKRRSACQESLSSHLKILP